MGTIRDGENILGEVFEHTNYGTCSTLASEQIKEVYCPLFRYYIGARISIKFTHGNTAGTCVGTDSNVTDPLVAPKISLNGQTHTIYVGGEPAGEGFINAGDVHDFVFDGENWADITADVIYKGGNDEIGYYEKQRNGKIEQSIYVTGGGLKTIDLHIPLLFIEQFSEVGLSSDGENANLTHNIRHPTNYKTDIVKSIYMYLVGYNGTVYLIGR